TYHLAVVVDDHLMQITHVIRGDEWISSTPKHIQLYKCFGWKAPEFAHLPLLLNADKSKLSKRQGDVAVSEYQKNGYLPEALINFVAFLGWNPGDEREIFSLQELIKEFNISKVNKTGAIFNVDKLNWFNKEYIKKLSVSELAEKSLSWFGDGVDLKKLERMISLERERVTTLAELPGALAFAFKLPDYTADQLVWRKGSVEEVRKILPELHKFLSAVDEKKWNKAELEKLVGEWVVKNGFSNGSVLWPLRVALSGQANSPGPFEIAEALGRLESMNRIETAIRKL
ncbi:MAG: glutamate--tRNA ligase family protein, partial [Patescibacteria group bacterium]